MMHGALRKWLRPPIVRGLLLLPLGFSLVDTGARAQAEPGPQNPAAESVAANPTSSITSLERARKSVEKFFEQAVNVVCVESVTQAIVAKTGKPAYREQSNFEYQLTASTSSGSLKLVESRDARKSSFRDPQKTLLVTNGFATLLLVLHPDYESSYQFEPAGSETVEGAVIEKFSYRPIPGASSPAAMRLRGKSYPLPLSGTIWIDRLTGAVIRMTSAVDSSLADLGLRSMTSDIHYAVVQFHDPAESYWMPVSATIDLETPLKHWRNVHQFSGYKRFSATIQIEAENKR